MEFRTYFSGMSIQERERFAERCKTTLGHLRNIAYGKLCGENLAIAIDRESSGVVRCEDLRPDVDWAYLRNSSRAAA